MERTHEPTAFVPSSDQRLPGHAARIKAWLEAQGVLPLLTNRSAEDLRGYEGGRTYLNLYGYLPCPEVRAGEVQCETTLTLAFAEDLAEHFEDPNGDWWTCRPMRAEVGWYSGGLPTKAARLRLDCIARTVEIAEAFDAAFGSDHVWTPGPTRAEREAQALKWRRVASKIKVAARVKDAIHTTCRLMRVGDERYISPPEGALVGTYEVEVEKKAYKVEVRGEDFIEHRRFQFRRTK